MRSKMMQPTRQPDLDPILVLANDFPAWEVMKLHRSQEWTLPQRSLSNMILLNYWVLMFTVGIIADIFTGIISYAFQNWITAELFNFSADDAIIFLLGLLSGFGLTSFAMFYGRQWPWFSKVSSVYLVVTLAMSWCWLIVTGHFRNLNWRYLPYIRPM